MLLHLLLNRELAEKMAEVIADESKEVAEEAGYETPKPWTSLKKWIKKAL